MKWNIRKKNKREKGKNGTWKKERREDKKNT